MFVSHWMTRKVLTMSPDDSVTDAVKLMKEKGIKHIPVLKGSKLKGILSDRDIKEYSPSKATTLDVYELHYLFARTKVKEITKKKVITTTPDASVEEAAMTMFDAGVGCLPVMEAGVLVGIISDRDIFRALVDITGVRHGGKRIYLILEDRPGSIKEVADIIRRHGFQLQSILTSYERVKEGFRSVVIRTKGRGNSKALDAELESAYKTVSISTRNVLGGSAPFLRSPKKEREQEGR
ncbi:MAG: CBS and ACT domain-containing protein [Nitrospirae bacterium]|nr:CBS and ACT domain-containing protein [Nitrospirota bacterium]